MIAFDKFYVKHLSEVEFFTHNIETAMEILLH